MLTRSRSHREGRTRHHGGGTEGASRSATLAGRALSHPQGRDVDMQTRRGWVHHLHQEPGRWSHLEAQGPTAGGSQHLWSRRVSPVPQRLTPCIPEPWGRVSGHTADSIRMQVASPSTGQWAGGLADPVCTLGWTNAGTRFTITGRPPEAKRNTCEGPQQRLHMAPAPQPHQGRRGAGQ